MEDNTAIASIWITVCVAIMCILGGLIWNNHQSDVIQKELILAGQDPVLIECARMATNRDITPVCSQYLAMRAGRGR